MPLTVLPGSGSPGTRVDAPTGDVTIDTAAIQAALALSREVLLQEGTYVLSQLTVTFDDRYIHLPKNCILKLANGRNTSLFSITGKRFIIDGAGTIDGNQSNQTGPAGQNTGLINGTGADNFVLGRDITVQETYGSAVVMTDTNRPRIYGKIVNSWRGHGFYWRTSTGATAYKGPVVKGLRVDRTAVGTSATYGYQGIKVNGVPFPVNNATTGGVSSTTITSSTNAFLQSGVVPPVGSIVHGLGFPVGLAVTAADPGGASITVSQAVTLTGTTHTVSVVPPVYGTKVHDCIVEFAEQVISSICIEIFCAGYDASVLGNNTFGGGMGISMDKAHGANVKNNACVAWTNFGIENAGCELTAIDGNLIDGQSIVTPGSFVVTLAGGTGGVGILIDDTPAGGNDGYGAKGCSFDSNKIYNCKLSAVRMSSTDPEDNSISFNLYKVASGLAGPTQGIISTTNALKGLTKTRIIGNLLDGTSTTTVTNGINAVVAGATVGTDLIITGNVIRACTNAVNLGTVAGTWNNLIVKDNDFSGCTNGLVGPSATVLLGTGCEVEGNGIGVFIPGSTGGYTGKLSERYVEINTGNTPRTYTFPYAYRGKIVTIVKNDGGTGTVSWATNQGAVYTSGGGAAAALPASTQYARATFMFNGTNWIQVG